jgi:hypothetical protein
MLNEDFDLALKASALSREDAMERKGQVFPGSVDYVHGAQSILWVLYVSRSCVVAG